MLSANSTARVRVAVAPLNSEPRISASQTSQLVAGQVVHLLEQQGDWWKVSGDDSYEGWMHAGYLEPAAGDEQHWRISLGATVHLANGGVHMLPLNARFPANAAVISGAAIDAAQIAVRFRRDAAAVVESAVTFYPGTSYLWGGVTPWGCDCSGLVQTLFRLHGFQMPRDAWQQAEAGTAVSVTALAATNTLQAFSAGDLLFFSDRADKRITHVGIAMGGNQFIHSGIRRGGVYVENLESNDAYVQQLRANFVCARRLSP